MFTVDDLRANNAYVNIHTLLEIMRAHPVQGGTATRLQARMPSHSLHDQKVRTVELGFYLGEDLHTDGTYTERRRQYLKLVL
jgi:hypothetical protein